ncbi:hypothetical protein BJX62DRAFT_240177 [Aspergillus germanicus]
MPGYVPPPYGAFMIASAVKETAAAVTNRALPAWPDAGGPQLEVLNEPIDDAEDNEHGELAWRAKGAPNAEFVLETLGPSPKSLVASPSPYDPRVMAVTEDNTKYAGGKEASGRWMFKKFEDRYEIVNAQYPEKCLTWAGPQLVLDHDRSAPNQQWDLRPPAW